MVASVATPAELSDALPSVVPEMENVTVPVGTAMPVTPVRVAVSETDWPLTALPDGELLSTIVGVDRIVKTAPETGMLSGFVEALVVMEISSARVPLAEVVTGLKSMVKLHFPAIATGVPVVQSLTEEVASGKSAG